MRPPAASVGPSRGESQSALLKRLKANPASWQLPADLADQLKLSREQLFEAIEALSGRGYSIDFHPYFGFRLVEIPDVADAEEITTDLNTKIVGQRVLTFKSVSSVNNTAWDLAEKGEPDGATVLAEEQTAGRARLGQTWFSPKGKGLYLAVLLRPGKEPVDSDTLAHYSVSAALAVANTLTEIVNIPAAVRWPNDVVVNGRKIASVWAETRPEFLGSIVVGVGINTHAHSSDFPPEIADRATSIQIETGSSYNHNRLARYVLFYFENFYQNLRRKKTRPVAAALREYSVVKLKHEVLITDAHGEHRGKVKDLDPGKIVLAEAGPNKLDLSLPHDQVLSLKLLQ